MHFIKSKNFYNVIFMDLETTTTDFTPLATGSTEGIRMIWTCDPSTDLPVGDQFGVDLAIVGPGSNSKNIYAYTALAVAVEINGTNVIGEQSRGALIGSEYRGTPHDGSHMPYNVGIEAFAVISGGAATIDASVGMDIVSGGNHGHIITNYGIWIYQYDFFGTQNIDTNIGLQIDDLVAGSVEKFAIRTGIGKVQLGDDLYLKGGQYSTQYFVTDNFTTQLTDYLPVNCYGRIASLDPTEKGGDGSLGGLAITGVGEEFGLWFNAYDNDDGYTGGPTLTFNIAKANGGGGVNPAGDNEIMVQIANNLTARLNIYGNGTTVIGGDGIFTDDGSGNSVAILELKSTTQGFLYPRMTTTERLALATVEGLTVYDVTLHGTFQYNGISWVQF